MFVELAPPVTAPVGHGSSTGPAGPGPVVHTARPARVRRLLHAVVPYLYVAPALVLLVVWTYRPLVQTAQLSFYSWNLLPTSPAVPVGLANYERLFELPDLGDSVGRTVVLILALLPFSIVVPVLVGLLTREVRGRAAVVYQAMVFAPMLVAPVASAAVWQWLLDPGSGVVNRVLGTSTNWLNDSSTAQLAIIVITGWHVLGFAVLIVSAGLAGINGDYADAAAVDGATRSQITRRITLPLLSPTLVFLALMTVLLSAQWTFPLIDTMTQGGPADATTNIYYLLWDYSFRSFDAGLGAAAGMVLLVGFGAVATALVWLSDRLTFHDN
ncbi:carbohydrate ABC transporter permease [Pseudonocardia abyssalis]|uniref:Sugar ABC transporter permease n=1 Tax=Pseudonocardia abyssalis TaxID=2792008 RepID=A0ABS6UNQ1_9PSEU|nr:sugar ABC transporter permease [Pseudonocardia abyssalis]MBW0116044.1 sugar ABC transporter permease [Pseudonocardia abyssalis]MBW0133876.1 sugar ABC transporter permease [Pseudonocardia abyssalis]